MTLQRQSSVPLYIQIKRLLKTQIENGEYPVGSQLPSERELAQLYSVSRMTARQALQALAQEGLTQSRVGTGTFVRSPKLDQELWTLTSFSEEMWRRGMTPSSRVRRADIIPATPDIAEKLDIRNGEEIARLDRVRLANDCPIAIEICHLPHDICPGILERNDFSRVSLYKVLRQDYGLLTVWADQTIQAGLSNEDERRALGLDESVPVLRLSRVTYDDHDRPIEYVRSVYRGDEYQLHAVLRGTNDYE